MLQLTTIIAISYFSISSLCCNHPNNKQPPSWNGGHHLETSSKTIDTLFYNKDTIVLAELIDEGRGTVFSWGIVGQYLNTGIDTLPYSPFGYDESSKKGPYYLIKDGCGTGCSYLYLMSFNSNDKGEFFYYPMYLDLSLDLIIYQGDDPNVLVTAENTKTGKVISIREEFDRTMRPYSLAIDSLFINDTELFLRWYLSDKSKKTKVFSLTSIIN
ncbi:MAG: hypothetical protein SF052_06135 [Bacteroidia bacterium]|nr:hypothetical protein [Bacteroidia bacterium]